APALLCRVDNAGEALATRDVERRRPGAFAELRGDLVGAHLVPTGDADLGASCVQAAGHRLAEPAGAAGDDRGPSLQRVHQGAPAKSFATLECPVSSREISGASGTPSEVAPKSCRAW